MDELELKSKINIQKLKYTFLDKPILFGGMAMEYYGLREHGDDVDFIITERDYQQLKVKFPNNRKDVWGDFGINIEGFELFRSIYKFDYAHYSLGAIELTDYKIINVDMLFRMKVFALGVAQKHDNDVQLLKEYYLQFQNQEYQSYMNRHIERYTSSESGIFVGIDYDDKV
ncbi:MAG: hypothetical protein U0Z26_07365 [Anaerolineales bacterium]